MLKGVVILLGVVFLALLGIFVYAVFSSYGQGQATGRFVLAPGEAVVEMAGAGDRLVLRLRQSDGSERIVYVDPRNGRASGELVLTPGP